AKEQERGDQLLLTQARTLVTTSPTGAVALLKQLVTPPERWARLWREARAIAAAARSTGVAQALPAPTGGGIAYLAPDGRHAATRTRIEGIRIYDLDTKTSHLEALVEPRGAEFVGAQHLAMWSETELVFVDLATGTRRTLAAEIIEATASTTALYYLDQQRRLWRMPVAGGEREAVPVDDRIITFAVSNDNRWLAVG